MDRTILTCKEFVRNTAEMGPAFVEPVTDTIEMIYDEMVSRRGIGSISQEILPVVESHITLVQSK